MRKEALINVAKLLVVALLMGGTFYLVDQFNTSLVSDNSYYLLAILTLLTALTVLANIWAAKNKLLVISFIASQVIRILLCLVIMYFFISSNPAEANSLVVNFFIIYLIFLIFEISTLLSNLRTEIRSP